MQCAQKSNKSLSRQGSALSLLGSLWPSRPVSHLENGHAVPFSPQDFCSPCEFVHLPQHTDSVGWDSHHYPTITL